MNELGRDFLAEKDLGVAVVEDWIVGIGVELGVVEKLMLVFEVVVVVVIVVADLEVVEMVHMDLAVEQGFGVLDYLDNQFLMTYYIVDRDC